MSFWVVESGQVLALYNHAPLNHEYQERVQNPCILAFLYTTCIVLHSNLTRCTVHLCLQSLCTYIYMYVLWVLSGKLQNCGFKNQCLFSSFTDIKINLIFSLHSGKRKKFNQSDCGSENPNSQLDCREIFKFCSRYHKENSHWSQSSSDIQKRE